MCLSILLGFIYTLKGSSLTQSGRDSIMKGHRAHKDMALEGGKAPEQASAWITHGPATAGAGVLPSMSKWRKQCPSDRIVNPHVNDKALTIFEKFKTW